MTQILFMWEYIEGTRVRRVIDEEYTASHLSKLGLLMRDIEREYHFVVSKLKVLNQIVLLCVSLL